MSRNAKQLAEPEQIVSGKWYLAAFGGPPFIEECCDCGLTHRLTYKIEDGKVWVQYVVDDKLTRKARKRIGVKLSKS